MPYVFLMPFLVLFGIFGLFPLLFSLYLAFHLWDPIQGIEAMHFVGLENFVFVLGDSWFWDSLGNTLWLAVVSGVPQHLIAIPLAYFMHRRFNKLRNMVLGIYFLPYITSTVAIAILFSALFSTDFGLINHGLHWLFPQMTIDWLGDPSMVKPAVAWVIFWRYVGFNTVLYLGALQTIPTELYEAARMDGASERQQFWYITLPMLKPIMYFSVILTVIGGFQLFEEPFVLAGSKGGPDQAAMTTAMYLYQSAFELNDFGAASAISWLLFVLILGFTGITHWLFKDKNVSK